jgi:hypothetical protein
MPVRFTADPPGPVPLHRIAEFAGKCKDYPVTDQLIPQEKQLCPGTGNGFSPVKYRPNLIPSL